MITQEQISLLNKIKMALETATREAETDKSDPETYEVLQSALDIFNGKRDYSNTMYLLFHPDKKSAKYQIIFLSKFKSQNNLDDPQLEEHIKHALTLLGLDDFNNTFKNFIKKSGSYDEEDILLEKVTENPVGVADALLNKWPEKAKAVLVDDLNGGAELDYLVALVILGKIKFDKSRNVYTNENDLNKDPQSKFGQPYKKLMENAVAQGIFKISDDGKASLSDTEKSILVEMQKKRDNWLNVNKTIMTQTVTSSISNTTATITPKTIAPPARLPLTSSTPTIRVTPIPAPVATPASSSPANTSNPAINPSANYDEFFKAKFANDNEVAKHKDAILKHMRDYIIFLNKVKLTNFSSICQNKINDIKTILVNLNITIEELEKSNHITEDLNKLFNTADKIISNASQMQDLMLTELKKSAKNPQLTQQVNSFSKKNHWFAQTLCDLLDGFIKVLKSIKDKFMQMFSKPKPLNWSTAKPQQGNGDLFSEAELDKVNHIHSQLEKIKKLSVKKR